MEKSKLSGAREAPLYPKSSGASAVNENQIPTPFNWYLSADKKTVYVVLKDGYELSVDINGDADTVDGEHASAFVDLTTNQTIGGTKTFDTMPVYDSDPIVESGSNSDGEWTRWADGTQMCFDKNKYGGGSTGTKWTYPKTFDETPITFHQNSGKPFMGATYNETESECYTRMMDEDGSYVGPYTSLVFAVGRWK